MPYAGLELKTNQRWKNAYMMFITRKKEKKLECTRARNNSSGP